SLKGGAKVMFIRNDSQAGYYNGKMGTVLEISAAGTVLVESFEGDLVEVEPVVWDNIQYDIDPQTQKIIPVAVGKFRQLPLRIAWAVTIHKSQGLTFDNVIIDAGAAFAFGQVYVALSRCRTLEGISLETPISASALYNDSHISRFNQAVCPFDSVQSSLGAAEKAHKFNVLREIFNFEGIVKTLGWFMKHWRAGYEKLYPTESEILLSHQRKLYELRKTADTFSRQITHIETTGASEEYLNERLLKAAGYFLPPFEQMRDFCNDIAVLEIDNKETKKNAKEAWTELMILLDILCGALGLISAGEFTPEAFGKIRTEYQLQERKTVKKKSAKSAVASKVNTPHEQLVVNEELRDELLRWRTARFKKDNVSAYTIMHQSTLLEIAARIPQNSMELLAIKGFGKAKLEKFGAEILEITLKYKKDTTQPCIF
ncbi:MAG: HRDC domain-containing protein, partial [Bacteroidales bacterium]|nr:HRDC domain-containing protein [Bacteroidales bacterium]